MVSLHMLANILEVMVNGVRNTSMNGKGIPLRMALGEVQKTYL